MFHPRNLILIAVFLTIGFAASIDDKVAHIEKFFSKWKPNDEAIVTHDLLIERPRNDTEHLRSKRSIPISQDYPISLNSGATRCWIPGYTGAHCEFPICDQLNRHQHGEPTPAPVVLDYNYRRNATIPTWFNVDSSIGILIIKLDSDSANSPRAQLFDANGNEIGNYNDVFSTSPTETIYHYDRTGLPGGYMIQPFSMTDNTTALRTIISGISDIDLDIEMGFVPNYGDNQPERSDYPGKTPFKNTLNVVVADVKFLEIPGSLAAVTIYSQNSEVTVPSPLRIRYGCSYKYYFDSFYCRDIGQYYARFEGYDFFGYSFTRWTTFECLPAPETTPGPAVSSTPAPTNPTSCLNNGVLITRSDSSTYCYCQGLWAGKQCEIPLCANGGTITSNSNCLCANGWTGFHCELLYCNDDAGLGYELSDPMVLFVIRLRKSMGPVIAQIRDQIPILQANFSFNPEYFKHFAVAFFNNDVFQGVQDFRSVDQFINVLNVSSAVSDTSGTCSDSSYTALWELVNQIPISKKSPIYVFTDALPDDVDTYEESIYQKNSYRNAPINFIFVESDPVNCPVDQYDRRFRAMNRMAERSSGQVHYVQNANFGNTGNLFYNLVYGTYFKGHLVYIDDERTCANQPLYETISVDSNDRFWKLTFVVVGDNITVSLVSPDQDTSIQVPVTYQLGRSYVFSWVGLQTGTWTFSVVSGAANTPCNFRVWALEQPYQDSDKYLDYNLVWGATPAIVFDSWYREPVWQQPLHIVAHIENYPNATRPIVLYPEFVNAELTIHAQTDNGRQLVLASNGIWRSGCSMQLFFPITNTFTCQQPDQILYLTIYVRDPKGYMIQRAGVFYCNYIRTTIAPSPSPGTCEHQGVFYNNTCICPPDWTGDYCQTPICYNGGTVVGGAFCECPPGVGGRNCEWLRCTQSNPYPGFNTNRRSIAFLLDITKYNVGPLNNLARTIQQTISDIRNQQTEWIENFYVYAYNSQNVTLLISAQPYDEGGIVAAFDQAARLASNGDTGCHILTYQAILAAVPSLTKNSFIYVYQSALPDERDFDAVVNASYMVDQNRHMLMVYFAQDDATHVGPYPECNGRRDEYDILEEIALLSQGRLYNLRSSSFPDTLKLLPTMYSSGVVYGRVFEDCSSAQTVFAPLDSYAQSMQVIIGGGGGNITYTINRPNGQPVSSQFVGTYLNDQLNGWKVLDIRRGCDDDWENNNDPNLPYCFNIKGGQQNWTIARDYCWVAGAYLLDDSTIDLDNFTSVFGGDTTEFWIGLNDVNTTGTYFWDRGRHNPPATFNATAFSKWGPGQPVNDSVKQCVYRKGQWYVDDCGLKKNFICMKHKYSASFEPNNLDDYDLPAGRWAITVSGGTGRCNVEVRVQSPMQIFTGYTNDQHSDFPTFGPYSNSNDNRIVAHVPGFDPQATNNVPFLTNAQIYDLRNSTMYAAATYEYRVECQYQFLSQNWTCPNGNNRRNLFAVLHTGKDSRGVPFQRMVTGRCAQQRVCLNNGILYNGQCVCPEYFTGENCTTPICVNGGFLDPTKQNCICPKGYTGRACQYQTCVNPSNKTFSSDDKTFMLVLEKTKQNQAAISSLQSNLPSILLSLGSHWFTTWVIVTFDSTGVTYAKSATTQLDFEANFNASIASITDPGNCMLPIFSALLNATQVTPPAIGSVQYLVTAGAPSDNDIIVGYQNYFGALSQYQLKLYYILSKTSGTGACQQDPNEKHVNTLVDYAYGSDGDFIIIEQDHVGPHATAYLPTLGNATVLGNPTAQNFTCQTLTYYFEVDRHATQIYLSTLIPTAASKPTVIDYNGNPLSVDNLYSDTSSHFLYKATPNGEGIYTISLNDNSGPCLLQIRLQGGLRWTPGYVVAPAQMPNISWQLDNATNVPMGLQNAMVVHTGNDEVRLTYASFFNPFVGVRTLVSFYPRDPFACSYQWVSDVFDCQSRYLLIHIYGFDVHAQPFRRSGYTFCAAYIGTNNASTTAVVTQATQPQGTSQQTQPMQTTQPVTQVTQPVQTTQPVTQVTQPVQTTQPVVTQTAATTPTTTTTKYFGLNVDVIFLLDISTAVTQSQFNDMTNFFLNALGTFNIATGPNSPNGTRFAIIQVPGDNWLFPLYSASFETITSYNMLKTAFANAWPDPNFDPAQAPGQGLLPNATALTVSDNVINSGYRKNINNHLAIYVTTTSNATQAAITAATNIRQGGVYSFLSLAYQSNGANTASLTSYVGGGKCLYQAQDANSLNGFANQLAEQIFTASNNDGKYTCT